MMYVQMCKIFFFVGTLNLIILCSIFCLKKFGCLLTWHWKFKISIKNDSKILVGYKVIIINYISFLLFLFNNQSLYESIMIFILTLKSTNLLNTNTNPSFKYNFINGGFSCKDYEMCVSSVTLPYSFYNHPFIVIKPFL